MQSYSFANKHKNLLEFSPHFATLIAEQEEEYIFQFVFRISQVAIATKYLSRLVAKCVNPNVIIEENSSTQKLSAMPQQKKAITLQAGKSEIDNVLFKHARQLKQAVAKNNSVIAEGVANLQNYVDPKVASALISGKKASDIEELYSYTDSLELTQNNFELPAVSTLSHDDIRKANLELISNYLMHPMEAVNYQTDIDIVNSIRRYYTQDALQALPREKAYYSHTKKKKLTDKITIPMYLAIPKRLVQGSFDVQLEVFKYERNKKAKLLISEVPVERKTTTVNLIKHLKFFKQPVARPYLESPTEDNPEVTATQRDSNSNYIRIEKKEMNNRGECTHYSIACESLGLMVGETSSISEAAPDTKFNIFRCISGDSVTTMLNPRVDGIISGAIIPIDTTAMVILDKLETGSTGAVEINIKNPPKYAAQFQISRSTWTGSAFGEKEIIVPYRSFDGESTLIVDDQAKNDHIYEYFLSYKTLTGEVRQSISRLHQYHKIQNTGVTVSIQSPITSMNSGLPTLKFDIIAKQTSTAEQTLTAAASQLSTSTLTNNNLAEINSLRGADRLDDMIYHRVVRVNLKNGVREDFNNLLNDTTAGVGSQRSQYLSDDPENRKKYGIENLDLTTDYLYEVRTHIRNPLSMLKGYVQQVKLPPSAMKSAPKIYNYRPHKWRQPSFSDAGTIPAIDDQNNLLTKKLDEDGQVGVTATYLLTGMNRLFLVNSLTAERVDENKIRLFWGLTGDPTEFDHFVVVKEVNQTRSLLGAFVGQELFDFLGPNDVGTIIYYVIPVFYDFSVSQAVRSNSLVVDPEELHFKQQIAEM